MPLPRDVNGHRGELRPRYNRAGAWSRCRSTAPSTCERIAYDAKGQRTLIAYGNGVMTRYAYDPRHLPAGPAAQRAVHVDGLTYRPAGTPCCRTSATTTTWPATSSPSSTAPRGGVPPTRALTAATLDWAAARRGDALDRTFTYDPLYRLMSATGREQRPPPGGARGPTSRAAPTRPSTRAYTETYSYDPVGNLLRLVHQPTAAHLTSGFTRGFATSPAPTGSQHLQLMTASGTPYDYTFDANGNLTTETTSRHFSGTTPTGWRPSPPKPSDAEPSVHAHYLYDATGNGSRSSSAARRARRGHPIMSAGSSTTAGPAAPTTTFTSATTSHASPSSALGPAHPDDHGPAVAFQLADHLGSSIAVLDGTGTLINREEYTPTGRPASGLRPQALPILGEGTRGGKWPLLPRSPILCALVGQMAQRRSGRLRG